MPKHIQQVYQLKIKLQRSKPPIWRRILVASDITLAGLHDVLQISMGWTDSHMHLFAHDGRIFADPSTGLDSLRAADERQTRLDQVLRREKDSLQYEYDFGDRWGHQVSLEKVLPHDPRQQLPVCVKAKGACPPEDIGGLWGYYRVLEVLRDPNHPDHVEYQDVYGPMLDPDTFDIDVVNEIMHAYFGRAA